MNPLYSQKHGNGDTSSRIDGWIEGRIEGTIEGRIEGTIDGRIEGRIDGRIDGRIEGRTEGRIEGRIGREQSEMPPDPVLLHLNEFRSVHWWPDGISRA